MLLQYQVASILTFAAVSVNALVGLDPNAPRGEPWPKAFTCKLLQSVNGGSITLDSTALFNFANNYGKTSHSEGPEKFGAYIAHPDKKQKPGWEHWIGLDFEWWHGANGPELTFSAMYTDYPEPYVSVAKRNVR